MSSLRRTLGLCLVSLSGLGLAHCGTEDDAPDKSSGGNSNQGGSGNATGGATTAKGGSSGGRVQAAGAGGEAGNAAPSTGGTGESGGTTSSEGGAGGSVWTTAGSGGEGGAPEPPAAYSSIFLGTFAPLAGYTGVSGQALLVRTLAGGTQVSVQVVGLTASTTYPVHVHAAPCDQGAGGGHYKRDPSVSATDEANELWLPITTDAAGVGSSSLDVTSHLARGDALSVVVHDPNATGTPKMACADFVPPTVGLVADGAFASFAQAEAIDASIAGTASLTRKAKSTHVEFAVSGLDPTAAYASHIHALPCGVTAAGGHYKRDTTVSATDENNELWVALGDTSSGSATGSVDLPHAARLDAQSMVIHRTSGGSAIKVACADLVVKNFGPLSVQGSSVAFTAATDRGYANLAASASLMRTLEATTEFTLIVTGLTAHSVYPTHVHNLPCALQSGGGHYKRDPSVATTDENNEFWLPFTADLTGGGAFQVSAKGTPRADARSIVIHDATTDAARLACIDLAP